MARDPALALAHELSDLGRRVRSIETGSQMAHRAIEGTMPVYDASGEIRGSVGVQPDGTTGLVTVNDPKPPTPVGVHVAARYGGFEVTWRGVFADEAAAPGDLARVEIMAATPDGTSYDTALAQTFTAVGGTVLVPAELVEHTVSLQAVTTGGERSEFSTPLTVTPLVEPGQEALDTANGKNRIYYLPRATPPPTAVLVDNDLWFVTDEGNKPYKRTGSTWTEATFGDGAISGLNVGKLVAGSIAAGQEIMAGPADKAHASLKSSGMHIYAARADGTIYETMRLGTDSSDYLGIADEQGNVVGAIDSGGRASFRALSVDAWPVVAGSPLDAQLGKGARGVIAHGGYGFQMGPITSELGLLQMPVTLSPGRLYRFSYNIPLLTPAYPASEVFTKIHITDDGSAPLVTSPVLHHAFNGTLDGFKSYSQSVYVTGDQTGDRRYRLLLSIVRGAGSGGINVSSYVTFTVEDVGPIPTNSAAFFPGNGDTSGVGGMPPVVAPPERYTSEYPITGFAGYSAYNGRVNWPNLQQGGGLFYDMRASGLGFDTGLIRANLAGATIESAELFIYAERWALNTGGNIVLGTHNVDGCPPDMNGTSGQRFFSDGMPNPGSRWIPVPLDIIQEFKAGTTSGFIIGAGLGLNHDDVFSGEFSATGAYSPRLRVTYTK